MVTEIQENVPILQRGVKRVEDHEHPDEKNGMVLSEEEFLLLEEIVRENDEALKKVRAILS